MSIDVALFGDIETMTVTWLAAQFTDNHRTDGPVVVSTRRKGGPDSDALQVVVSATNAGGFTTAVTDEAVVILRAYAPTEEAAQTLCQLARSYVKALALTDEPVAGVEVFAILGDSGVYRFPDPDITTPSYQTSIQILAGPTDFLPVTQVKG